MANITMVPGFGMGITVSDPRWTPTDVASPAVSANFLATQDIRTLDARLTALNAAYWTAARLAQESIWDKLFYIRSDATNAGGIPV